MDKSRIGSGWEQFKDQARDTWEGVTTGLGRVAAETKGRVTQAVGTRLGNPRARAEQSGRDLGHGFSRSRDRGVPGVAGSLALVGLGAGLMYFLDPDRGRRRRALVRDQLVHTLHEIDDAVGVVSRDLANRSQGAWVGVCSLPGRLAGAEVPDGILVERVRSKMGRFLSHPSSIEVTARWGRVTLSGPVLAHEVDDLLAAVASVPGVADVENRLEVHEQPGDVPGLQGGRGRPGEQPELMQLNWSPAARLLVGLAGGALLRAGTRRGGLAGLALGAVGTGLLARAITNVPVRSIVGIGATRRAGTGLGRRPLEVRKTITIAAPVEDVFAAWADYENFPRFLSRVREVRDLGDGRSHWVVAGPAGTAVHWNAVLTQYIPNEVIAWGSEPDAEVPNSGIIHFRPAPDGGTQVSVQLSYSPPAGALGHGLAWLFGADPKQQLDEDLARLKTFLETGRPPHDASQPAPLADATVPGTST